MPGAFHTLLALMRWVAFINIHGLVMGVYEVVSLGHLGEQSGFTDSPVAIPYQFCIVLRVQLHKGVEFILRSNVQLHRLGSTARRS